MNLVEFLDHDLIKDFNKENKDILIKLEIIFNNIKNNNRIGKNTIKLEIKKYFIGSFKINQLDFWLLRGWTEIEAKEKIKIMQKGRTKNQVEYWIKKGHSQEEAEKEVSKFQSERSLKGVAKGSHKGKFSKFWFQNKYGDNWEFEYQKHNKKKTKKIKKSSMTDNEWNETIEKKRKTYYSKSNEERKEINERRTVKLKKGFNNLYSEEDFIKKFGEEGKQKWEERNKKISDELKVKSSYLRPEFQEKCKQTMKDKYGSEHPMHIPEIREKQKESIKNTWENNKDEILYTKKNNIIKKYGSLNEYKKKFLESFNNTIYAQMGGKEFTKEILEKELKTLSPLEIANKYNVDRYSVTRRIKYFDVDYTFNNISYPHKLIRYILDDHNIEYIENKRILNGKELDIYIPEKQIGIEINGIYWHSEISNGKTENYHLEKTICAKNKGIFLFHFTDYEIINKFEVVESLILNKLNKNKKIINHTDCVVSEISKNEKEHFLRKQSIIETDNASISLGLFYKQKIVSIMTFTESNKKSNFELLNQVTKNNFNIFNGNNILFEYFINKYNPNFIYTYIDRRFSEGNNFKKLGFQFSKYEEPDYHIVDKNYNYVGSRRLVSEDKLKNVFGYFNPSFSMWDNIKKYKGDRIWDCGQIKMIWKK